MVPSTAECIAIRTTIKLVIQLALDEGLMVKQGSFLFIFCSLTRAEARGPAEFGPLLHFLRGDSIFGCGATWRFACSFSGCSGFGWRKVVVVWFPVILGRRWVRGMPENGPRRREYWLGLTKSVAMPTPFAGRLV